MPASRAATAICSAPFEWPSRPGLADEDPQRSAEALGRGLHLRPHREHAVAGRRGHAADAGRGAVLAEDVAERAGPLADRPARLHERDRRLHQVRVGGRDGADVARARRRPRRRRGRPATSARLRSCSRSASGSSAEDVALTATVGGERRRRGLGEAVDADDLARPGLDRPDALGVRLHEPALDRVDHGEGPAALEHPVELLGGGGDELGDLRLDHLRPLEEVPVLEQVGLEREDLLHPQRPLLVPRAGEAERLVPAGQLDRAGPRVARAASRRASRARCAARCSRAAPR